LFQKDLFNLWKQKLCLVTHLDYLHSQYNWEIRIMMGQSVLFALATMAAALEDREVPSICHSQLAAGQKFEIETEDHVFRAQLVNRSTGECQMALSADGRNFTPARTVYLLGATAGPQPPQMLVLMHEVKVGLKMELGLGDLEQKHRLITGEVKAIRLGE
jgi:hypothetical protein